MKEVLETGDLRWLAFLRSHELAFNAELHLLQTGQKQVICLPDNGTELGYGWFLTFADSEAGEWNLGHPFGSPALYQKSLDFFPPETVFHLLIPTEDFSELRNLRPLLATAEKLIWHKDPADLDRFQEKQFPSEIFPGGGEFRIRCLDEDPSLCILENQGGFIPRSYLMAGDSIASMVRVIHATAETLEIYIETVPEKRGIGLGTWLLGNVINGFRTAGRRLVYVTSEENTSSRRVAEKLGLAQYQVLHRCVFKRTPSPPSNMR